MKLIKLIAILSLVVAVSIIGYDLTKTVKIRRLNMSQYNGMNPNLVFAKLVLKGIHVEIKTTHEKSALTRSGLTYKMILDNDGAILRHREEYMLDDHYIDGHSMRLIAKNNAYARR